jgi:pimeloyl-ACP methyl ester carboxylesterase
MKKKKSLFKTSVAAITTLHFINKYIDSSVTSSANRKSGGKFYHWKNGDIYYMEINSHDTDKEPLLLVHDLTVFSSGYEWNQIIKGLSKDYRVFTLDLIGCGKSDKPEITYTNYFYVQMIHDFSKEVIGEPVKVIATGLSSSFILMANSIHKDLFTDITIISPKSLSSMKKTPDDRSKILIKLFNLPVIGKTAYYIAVNKQNTEYELTEKYLYNPFHLNAAVSKAYYDAAHMGHGNGKMLLASLQGNYLNIDITNALKNAENKITLIFGEHSENSEEIQHSYEKIKPDITVKTVADAKLLPQLEAPEALLELL